MSPRPSSFPGWRFQLVLAIASSFFCVLAWLWNAAEHIPQRFGESAVVVLVICAVILPIAAHYREKGQFDRMDAVLTIPWGVILGICIVSIVQASALARFPLRDTAYGAFDSWLGVSVPAIREWSLHHALGRLCNACYPLLNWFLLAALLLPALAGRASARTFLLANMIAFAVSVPIFTLWPAIGPWYAFHTPASPAQLSVQRELLDLHRGGVNFDVAGVVSFPSFHVIWAILAAAGFSTFRVARIPAMLLCGLVIASTMTTGWHYFADVLSGAAIAAASLYAARSIESRLQNAGHAAVAPAVRAECAVL